MKARRRGTWHGKMVDGSPHALIPASMRRLSNLLSLPLHSHPSHLSLLPLSFPLLLVAYTSIIDQVFERDPDGAMLAFADMMKKGIVSGKSGNWEGGQGEVELKEEVGKGRWESIFRACVRLPASQPFPPLLSSSPLLLPSLR